MPGLRLRALDRTCDGSCQFRPMPLKNGGLRMFLLDPRSDDFRFPPVEFASPEGLVAVGGDLRAERLLEAYRHGIFPWYNEDQPILWWSPDPRCVLLPAEIKVSRSLAKTLRSGKFRITFDAHYSDVMRACAGPRIQNPQGGTWITDEMLEAYFLLHERGYAHSVETWCNGELVGGLYGVALGGAFFGESMFSRASDASKVALVHLALRLESLGFTIIDCQMTTPHLVTLGAREIRRTEFLLRLDAALAVRNQPGPWRFEVATDDR
jgi:leucyl/phenylalanyl-tRNA---protein transferase